jgi:septum formation protein
MLFVNGCFHSLIRKETKIVLLYHHFLAIKSKKYFIQIRIGYICQKERPMKTVTNISFKNIILASNSPRRKELLENINIPFEVKVKDTPDETYPDSLTKIEIPEYLAIKKASFYSDEIEQPDTILITADTIVYCDNLVLGKPENYKEAFDMLKLLSGKAHEVITGVAITSKEKQIVFNSVTKVFFKEMTDDEIDYYIQTFKPYDKAGAYGIQEWIGMVGIEKIEGSYYNVVGLPVQKLYSELLKY